MNIKKHPDYEMEFNRLEETKTHIEHTIVAVENYRKQYQSNIKDAMSNMEPQDSSSSYIDAMINTQFVEIADRNYDNLIRVRKKPYFARIDFIAKETGKKEQLYIGKTSLLREGEFTPLVVDWRAPISTLYYEGRLGENEYESEGDIYKGELTLKRQITISEGQLVDFIDVDITTNDAFLQASLEASADQRLKDIASTIQAEQNKVIRANMRRPLIVQGVAGSGKTTIALHRIAYFIYTYEKSFNPESFMIIAPNRLFLNYISEVLPELGVEKVKQTTYIDFMMELIGKKITLTDRNQTLIQLVHQDTLTETERTMLLWHTKFKGSMQYRDGIERYLTDLEKNFTPPVHFVFQNEILVSRSEIRSFFLHDYQYLPFYKRVHEIKKILTSRLKLRFLSLTEETKTKYNDEIDRILRREEEGEERKQKVIRLMDQRDQKIKDIQSEHRHAIKEYMSLFPEMTFQQAYERLLLDHDKMMFYFGEILSEDQIKYHLDAMRYLQRSNKYDLEDLSALLLVKHRLYGFNEPVEVTTLVIDEAQDFSQFQFWILKHVLKTDRLTLLGDLSQGIHEYRGTSNWDDVIRDVFPESMPSYMTLEQSYRTTVEIMNLANKVLAMLKNDALIYAKPVIRHGMEPTIRAFDDQKAWFLAINEKVDELKNSGYKSIAIIGKTLDECQKIKKYFDQQKKHDIKILDDKVEHYHAGLILVPSYFAKGLEFDAVIIANQEESYQQDPLDIKLLYVAMTRSLHRLDVIYVAGTQPLLDTLKTI